MRLTLAQQRQVSERQVVLFDLFRGLALPAIEPVLIEALLEVYTPEAVEALGNKISNRAHLRARGEFNLKEY